jgi:hypothetical protein
MAVSAAIAARRRAAEAATTRSGTLAPDLPTRSVPYAVPMAMALALAAVHPRALHLLP